MSSTSSDRRVIDWFFFLFTKLSALCFALALLINFSNVVGRYIFHMPIFWAEEITVILIIWSVSLMSFQLTVRKEHLVTEILKPHLSLSMQNFLLLITTILGIIISLYISYNSYLVVELVSRFGQVTTVAEIPKSLAYSSITVMFLFSAIGGFLNLFQIIKNNKGK